MRQEHFGATGASSTQAPEPAKTTAVQQPAKVVPFKRYLTIAVAVAAVLITGLLVWNPFAPDLYATYSATQMAAQVERGSRVDSVLQNAAIAFNNKAFTEAAVLLAEVVQTQPDNSYALFYFGVAFMQSNQVPRARAVFEKLVKGESAFKYEATFYEALSYLKEGDKDTIKDWLERIPADAPNYRKAQELMRKLYNLRKLYNKVTFIPVPLVSDQSYQTGGNLLHCSII